MPLAPRAVASLTALILAVSTTAAAGATSSRFPAPDLAATATTAAALRERALAGHSSAWELLESLTTDVGARPVASSAMERARDWAAARLTALHFTHVHAEPFVKEHAWIRGRESAALVSPAARPLAVIGLGNSVPTPAGGIEAEVVAFSSLAALAAAPAGSVDGRIALVNQPMVRTQDGAGYGPAVRVRSDGASVAAAHGAVAFLTRSVTTGNARAPHTGAMRYADGVMRIPAAALGVADADLLSRLAARGAAPRIRLSLESTLVPASPAWNVVGEIEGHEPGAGTIVIGGHLDSWDPGQGAVDDGAGVAISIAAAHLIGELPLRPRRTIRVVAWGSEETDGSGGAFASAHAGELPQFVLAGECDSGSGRAYRLSLPAGLKDDPTRQLLESTLGPLRIFLDAQPARSGGADVEPLQAAGVPVFAFQQDASSYFDIHHSADDTLDKVDRADLEQNVAAWAALLYVIADSGVELREPASPAR
jgi:hypothetical protein